MQLPQHGSCNEGLVYGLLTTTSNLGKSIPQAISNQLFGTFQPALSNSANYLASRGGDQPCFRRVVAWSVLVSYGFALASLLTLPLLPDQKAQAQQRKAQWPSHVGFAVASVMIITLAMAYSLTVNVLSILPATMCMQWLGGAGCNATIIVNASSCS